MLQPAKTDWVCSGETVGTSSADRPVSHLSPHTLLRRPFLLACVDEPLGDYFHWRTDETLPCQILVDSVGDP
jgi:hypothetical protein